MIVTAFTLIYSTFFLEYTLTKCDVILKEDPNNTKKQALLSNNSIINNNPKTGQITFKVEEFTETNECNEREKAINKAFLQKDDFDKYPENDSYKNKNEHNYSRNDSNYNSNYFAVLREKAIKLNEDYLIPLVNREERISTCSNSSNAKINLENINMKDLKKKLMEKPDDEL